LQRFDYECLDFEILSEIVRRRRNFCFVELNNEHLLMIGGIKKAKRMTDCDTFNTTTKEWKKLSSLCTPRSSHTAFVINDRIVYAYGGYTIEKSKIMEKIELDDKMNGKWSTIVVNVPDTNAPTYFLKPIPINNDEILLIGGKDFKCVHTDRGFIFNRKTNEFTDSGKTLVKSDDFNGPATVFKQGDIYYIFSLHRRLHMVKIKNQKLQGVVLIDRIID